MKFFVTGVGGQLGNDVASELLKRGHTCIGSDIYKRSNVDLAGSNFEYLSLDIVDDLAVKHAILEIMPDVVIHCAAWTAVDLAEEEENLFKVREINVHGTENLAIACKEADCKMFYISTDYVFDGKGIIPWEPDCKEYKPLNVYGQSKLDGELCVSKLLDKYFIVRIAWVFGKNGNNFIKTMLRIGKTYKEINVVNDQIGLPTYTYDLSRLIVDMAETEKYGYYHATNEGEYISWYDFACEIFKIVGYDTKINPVTTEEYGLSRAQRPFNSRLSTKKLIDYGFVPLPDWKDALKRYLREIDN